NACPRLYVLKAYELGVILDASMKCQSKQPIMDVADAARAVLREAVRTELRRALATDADTDDLVGDFAVKLAEIADEPSSICCLTQPYIQAMARNSLVDQPRAAPRAALRRPSRPPADSIDRHAGAADEGSPECAQVDLAYDLRTVLTPQERRVLELRVVEGFSDLEIADRLAVPLSEVQQMAASGAKALERYRTSRPACRRAAPVAPASDPTGRQACRDRAGSAASDPSRRRCRSSDGGASQVTT